MSIKIILADDHAIVRSGLARLLQQQEGIEIVGQADNGVSAVALTKQLSPDVVVMDIGMPDLNGIEATRQIVKESPRTKVVGLSMHSSKKYIREMFKAGASGYLLKNCPFEELTEAINIVIGGKTYISPSISTAIIGDYISGACGRQKLRFRCFDRTRAGSFTAFGRGKDHQADCRTPPYQFKNR